MEFSLKDSERMFKTWLKQADGFNIVVHFTFCLENGEHMRNIL